MRLLVMFCQLRLWIVGLFLLFGGIYPVSAGITHCPTNRVLSANSLCAAILPDLTAEVESSDGGIATQDPVPGTLLSLGTNVITFSLTDTNGATDSCTAVLTVVDDTPPIFVACATNRSLAAGGDCLLTMPNLSGELSVTDACSSVTVIQDPPPGTALALGNHVVTFTATDAATNSSTCTLTLSVIDSSAPAISSGPTNMTLSAVTNCEALVPDLTTQIVASDCSPFTITQNPLAGSLIPLGTNELVLTVTDTNGLSAAWSVFLTVVDDIPPVFVVCATNRSLAAGGNCLLTLPDFTGELTVTDACSAVTVIQEPLPGTALAVGNHPITFTATDAATNTSTCVMTLSVIDSSAPVISSGPTNSTLSAVTNCAAIVPDLTTQIVASDCSLFTIAQNPLAGSLIPLGTNEVVLTVTDTNGLSAVWSVIFTVVDDTPPVFVVCATNRSLGAGTNCVLTIPDLTGELTVTDACSAVTLTQAPVSGTTLALGDHLVTFTARDAVSNSSTCTMTLSVIDNSAPVISAGPTNMTLTATTNCAAVAPDLTGQVVASDCSAFTVTQNPLAGSLLSLGTNTVVLTATDTNGFSASVSARITVLLPTSANTNITISEFMAQNTTTLADEDGAFSDWIEIHNAGTCPLNLNSWSLTDNPNVLTKWRFPNTNIAAGQFLVVWASNKDRRNPGAPLHTNFKMADEGEYLALVQPDGVTIATQFSPTFPPQFPNVSYGLPSDVSTNTYLAVATPGAPNSVSTNFNCATNITISEFMAKNTVTITDEDGTFSDWIEIRNGSSCSINLNNWCLTDDPAQLTKWRLPGTNLASGQFLVVWASSKDRRNLGSPLHTNFKLAEEGEYLALVQPNGTTIATQFSPAFPIQFPDVSYGFASDTLTNTYLAYATPGTTNGPSTNFLTGACATNIIISEFMAKNTNTISDEDGAFSDWIEIHNGSSCDLDLNNWCLTDDPADLIKWRFPATNLPPGQFLVVWASNKNRRAPGAPLHTNFKLADEGEYLALVKPDGVTIASQFSPAYPPQIVDVTYGLPSNRTTNAYLAFPTPGAPNAPATNYFISALRFKPPRGWYTNSVSVFIGTPTSGAVIHVTADGSTPSLTNGLVYTNSLFLFLTNTTVVRAAAFLPGFQTAYAAHTYVFPQNVAHQTGAGFPATWGTNQFGGTVPAIYVCASNVVNNPQWSNQIPTALLSIPTVSIAINNDDMFGTNGLYSNTLLGLIDPDFEKACSMEYFSPSFPEEFQVNCGVQMQGSFGRDPLATPKHNFRMLFKERYGPSKLNFNMFPGSPVSEFNTLALHGSINDHWFWLGARAQMLRDQWASDTQRETGGFGRHGVFVNLFVNGLYWGLYNFGERPDAPYAASYLGGQTSEYDALSADEVRDGTNTTWIAFLGFCARPGGINSEAAYSNVVYNLDVPTFIDYMLMNFYGANQDWADHNYWTTGSPSHGVPFHYFSYDAEEMFLNITNDLTGLPSIGSPGIIYNALRQWPPFVRLFGDHAQKLLFNGGALTPDRAAARWMKRAHEINLAIISESARWGYFQPPWVSGPVMTQDTWLAEQTNLLANWFPQRTDIFIQQLRNAGLLPGLEAPTFTPFGGIIVDSLPVTMSAPAGAIYYTINGSDPETSDGNISPNALLYTAPIALTNTVLLRARVLETNTWSALTEATYQLSSETTVQIRNVALQAGGSVKLNFLAWPGVSYTLQASTNLQSWQNLATLTPPSDGLFDYIDSTAPNYRSRFYRLVWP